MELIAFYNDEPVKAKNSSVAQLPISEAVDYTFGNEPMTVRTVYVTHPRVEKRLVPYGQYDQLLMDDKFNEALRIVQTLGAHTIQSRSYRGDLARLAVNAKTLKESGSGGVERANRAEVHFEQIGTGGQPRDPGPTVYPDAPGFEAARRAVLLNGARHVEISIESQSAFRADSDITIGLKKLGFSLGIAGEKAQVRLLKLQAWFPQRGKLHAPDEATVQPLVEPRPPLDPEPPEKSLIQKLLGN